MEDFERIFSVYYGEVYRLLLRLSKYDAELAEECTQETFYQAYLSLPQFKGQCEVKTWLIQIAKNRFYMLMRKQKKRLVPYEAMKCEPNTENMIEQTVEEQQITARARDILNGMTDNMRDVMVYRIFADLPYVQIAALLNISEASAKVLFYRGKKLLRKRLKEDYGYEV